MSNDQPRSSDLLTRWMDAGDHEPLLRATDAEAEASLRQLLDEHEADAPDVDGDRLARVGWTLARARKWIAPVTVVTWLKEQPNHNRLAIAISVLMVSWNPAPDEPPPDPVLVEELLTVYDSLPFDVVSDNYMLMLLSRANKSVLTPSVKERIHGMFDRAVADADRPSEIRDLLARYLASH